ncbi:pilus assembly protein [Massilia sp. CCM 8734]|uniref:pilus assembly protein n=1 Tax=Massilia sp. CCM 8734 TaxID=2609283 RepID=UPI00141DAD4B|nr:PilC/PilY family type IV pilus protein [Massilia sp. CCM 8734]NHZ97060.1 hypothetical protein [Massilia sp. CCM 8734]
MQLRTKLLAGASLVGLAVAALVAVNAADRFEPTQQPVGYIGRPTPSNIDVSSGNEKMYSIDYSSFDWSGNLHAYPITKTGAIGTEDSWTGGAGAKIRAQSATQRIIVTRNDASGAAGIPFRWASLAKGLTGHREKLDKLAMDAASSDILDYVRGDSAKEIKNGGTLRTRFSGLGDIIHSTPVYHNDGTNKTVFVGANDGMLHAINATDGTERFAYIPGAVMGDLAKLASKDYTHRYYVDGGIALRTMEQQTILVGALGGGGKALFALDVTSMPTDEASAASKVMWEVNNQKTGFEDLGYTYSAPVLARIKPDATATPIPMVVVGNGYNSDHPTATGHAVLYVMNAKTGALIRAMDTGVGAKATPNGLSSPSVRDTDNDGYSDTAFAGDIEGNMWKFDLVNGGTPKKLHAGGTAGRAITMAPALAAHPSGGTMVMFVTGRILTPTDMVLSPADTTNPHYAYGVWDLADVTKASYVEQILGNLEYQPAGAKLKVRTVTNKPLNYSNDVNKGWQVALPPGERVVGNGAYVNGNVFQFFSTNPTVTPNIKPPGENWWMQLNYLTGGDTRAVVFDLNDDRKFTADDLIDVTVAGPPATTTTMYPVGRHMGGGVRSQLVGVAAGGVDVFQASFDRNGAATPPIITEVDPIVMKGERGVSGGHFDTDFFCYTLCGGAQSNAAGTAQYGYLKVAGGYYGLGRASDTASVGAKLNYIHVHEYDDIYDVTGISMINPSQDLQRLHKAFSATSTSTTYSVDTPGYKATKTYPSSATVTAGPTKTETLVNSNNQKNQVSYNADTAYEYISGPVPALVDGKFAMVTKRKYTSTVVLNNYTFAPSGNSSYPYKQTRERIEKSWDTVVTENVFAENKEFKLLMANQEHSPAINFKVAGALVAGKQAEYDGGVTGFQTADNMKVSEMTKYSMASVKEMMWSMPLNAFNIKEWVPGPMRTGVHPMSPVCAGISIAEPKDGKDNAWRNGALTLQVVSANITQDDIQLNVPGQPALGYRLKSSSYGQNSGKLIAEYLIYWHHPVVACMTDGTYKMAPDKTDKIVGAVAVAANPAQGSKDPHGVFVPGAGETPSTIPPPPENTVIKNDNGSITTIVWRHEASGTEGGYIRKGTQTISWPNGGPATGPATGGGIVVGGEIEADKECKEDCDADKKGGTAQAPNIGRINWRELQR